MQNVKSLEKNLIQTINNNDNDIKHITSIYTDWLSSDCTYHHADKTQEV